MATVFSAALGDEGGMVAMDTAAGKATATQAK